MNLPLDNFENELKRMHPVNPHRLLCERIEAEIQKHERATQKINAGPWLKRLIWAPMAVSLVFVVGLCIDQSGWFQKTSVIVKSSQSKNEQSQANMGLQPKYDPVITDNYLVAAQEDGIIFSHSSAPLRKVKYRVISSSEWFDDTEKATVQLLSPHEEVVLLPMNVH